MQLMTSPKLKDFRALTEVHLHPNLLCPFILLSFLLKYVNAWISLAWNFFELEHPYCKITTWKCDLCPAIYESPHRLTQKHSFHQSKHKNSELSWIHRYKNPLQEQSNPLYSTAWAAAVPSLLSGSKTLTQPEDSTPTQLTINRHSLTNSVP